MALTQIDLICPDCKVGGSLWISPREFYNVECRTCGRKWGRDELNEICTRLAQKAKVDRNFKWWADCLRIQMQHMINPFTGKSYAKTPKRC